MNLSHEQFGDRVDFTANAVFYKRRSWVKPSTRTDAALKHEQGHFDLTEIYTRRLREELTSLSGKGAALIKKAYRKHAELNAELKACQERYDAETEHHLNQVAQDKWDAWIVGQLQSPR